MLLVKLVNVIFHVEYVYAYHDQDSRKHDFSFKNEHVIKRLKVAKYEGFQIV